MLSSVGTQVKAVTGTQQLRKPHWFEKFNWFVTSENHLVLSGRDAQQNELLVKRYLRKDDLYVHADLHGAATTIIRNNDPAKAGETLTPISMLHSGSVPQSRAQRGYHSMGAECISHPDSLLRLFWFAGSRASGPDQAP